jgi:hypothetical protein
MTSDVFISYSHKDKITTDLMCDTLEENGIKCWVAPRDILPGSEWSGAIIHGIESTKIMVLVFSNISGQVVREVERAVSKNIIIIPFKIEDVKMSPSMEYLVSMSHWLNACDQPLENKLTEFVENVKKLMQAKIPVNYNNTSENIGNTNSKIIIGEEESISHLRSRMATWSRVLLFYLAFLWCVLTDSDFNLQMFRFQTLYRLKN